MMTRRSFVVVPLLLVLSFLIMTPIVYWFNDCFSENIDEMGYVDKQLWLPVYYGDERIVRSKFIATRTSKIYNISLFFFYPEGFSSDDAARVDLFNRINTIAEMVDFFVLDDKGESVRVERIYESKGVSSVKGIKVLLGENFRLKKGSEYSVSINLPDEFDELLFLSPVIYITKRRCPTL